MRWHDHPDPKARRKKTASPWGTPHVSIGAGVHSNQVSEFNQLYKDHGITGAHHRPDGKLEENSRGQRAKVHKLRHIHDQDAGYGDYAGDHACELE